jgi:Ca-activated chloride channel family protein
MKVFILALSFTILRGWAQDAKVLINVEITVANSNGFVTSLPQDAFAILEDGTPQTAQMIVRDERPVSIGLIVDDSGTMREFRAGLVQMVEAFLKRVDARDEVSLIRFNTEVTLAQDFTNDPSLILTGLRRGKLYGRTRLSDALNVGIKHLVDHGKNERRVLIVISDGIENTGTTTRDSLFRLLADTGVVVYALEPVSLDFREVSQAQKQLAELTKPTGGIAYNAERMDELVRRAEQIAREIHSQYWLAYSSSNSLRDGKFRKIKVSVTGVPGKRIEIRARSGYYAGR